MLLTNIAQQPLSQAAIDALHSVQLFADTHDQGWVTDRALGNWTWLEIALYDNESSNTPKLREGVELVWHSHKNDMGSKEFDWVSSYLLLDYSSGAATDDLYSFLVSCWREHTTCLVCSR